MKNKMINCATCGAEIAKNAKACPHCGAKIKKPFYKKWWVWVIVVFIVIGSFGNSSEEPTAVTPEPTVTITESPAEATASIETTEEEPQAESFTDNAERVELIIDVLESTGKENFDYFKVEGDETGFTIYCAVKGVAADVVFAKAAGYDSSYAPWVESKEAMCSFYDSAHELIETFGMDDFALQVLLLNDQNHDNILLGIMFGEVIYDAMNE